jgi:glycosyl transferase family 92
MNLESGKRWERFLEYAALARVKPTFDVEERDWRLSIAERMQEALRAAREGGDWLALLSAVYRKPELARFASPWAHGEWFNALATANPESARSALAAFSDTVTEAEKRFSSFVRTLEEAEVEGQVEVDATGALTLGSVCNFAIEPLEVPMMRPGPFGKLEQILGYRRSGPAAIADAYAEHLAFARLLRSRMEEAGLPVRDMIDVHSLIFIAAQERQFWAGERLYAIGVPTPPERRDSRRGEDVDRTPYLSICASYRNESPYLQEWIEFHRLVGVDHFFLYDAHSTDAYEEVLGPYIEEGIVTDHHWEGISYKHSDTYNEFLREHSEDSRWVAFIDCDEFLFSPAGRPLPEVLSDYEQWPGVGVNWALFGRSGHITKPPGLVIENYLMRVDSPTSMFIKCIVDPSRAARCRNGHEFEYHSLLAVDENHYPIHGTHTKSTSFARLRLNHYVTKSDEEARAKLGRPKEWQDSRVWRSTNIEDNFPQERDDTITRYLPALRKALAARVTTGRRP